FQSDSHKTPPPFQTHGNFSSRFVRLRRAAPYNPGHPVGGEGVGSSALDDGGLWSSDEARAEESPGVLEGRDGSCPLARRAPWDGTATVETVSTFRLPAPPQGAVRDAGEAREGPPAGGASVQRPRGTARLVETVHTPTTGRARLSRTLPTACPQAANSRAFSLLAPGRDVDAQRRQGGGGPKGSHSHPPAVPTRSLPRPPSPGRGGRTAPCRPFPTPSATAIKP